MATDGRREQPSTEHDQPGKPQVPARSKPGAPGSAPPVAGLQIGARGVLQLQQLVGNRAVTRMLHRARADQQARDAHRDSGTGQPGKPSENVLSGLDGGRPLDGSVASRFGSALGGDFSDVRIHTGSEAAGKASAMRARAFTYGHHVGFDTGQYQPGTLVGDAVLAHELAHVQQQRNATATLGTASRDVQPDGGSSQEHAFEADADQAATGALAKLWGFAGDVVNGALSAPQRLRAARPRLQRCDPTPPGGIAPPLAPGEQTKEFTREEYAKLWEKKNGKPITGGEMAILKKGCIGITMLNLQGGNKPPPLDLSFSTFEKAKQVAAALNAILQAKPAVDKLPDEASKHPALKGLKNVVSSFPGNPDPKKWRAVIFSKRFFSNQSSNWHARNRPSPGAFRPDPKTGQVDMSNYKYEPRTKPGSSRSYTNFDYGWYDEKTDTWWHANHAEPNMKVYQSTLKHYSRPLRDFDRQVFTVTFARNQ